MKSFTSALLALAAVTAASPAFANVLVTSPQKSATTGTNVNFVATANTTTCSRGVASMGVYVDNSLRYVVNGTRMNTSVAVSPGKHNVVVQEWDFCGGATKAYVPLIAAPLGSITISSPTNQSTVSPQTSFVATATSNCPSGVTALGVLVDQNLAYKGNGSSLNTQLTLTPGPHHAAVQSWDACGGGTTSPVDITVTSSGNVIENIQASGGWKSSGQIAPYYNDCVPNCPGVSWSMEQNVASPSLSGKASRVDLGGDKPYSDVLYYNQLIGDYSTQGLPDLKRTLMPTLHDFTYDAYFYVPDGPHTQAMEFDINWFMHGVGITWGTECRIAGGNEWDIWDNVNAHWIPTGFACNPISNGWNHVVVNAQRGPNNEVIYQSITLNGNTSVLNKTYAPFQVPYNWFGVTVNYQMDGDRHQTGITSYVDKMNLSYK